MSLVGANGNLDELPHFFWGGLDHLFQVNLVSSMPEARSKADAVRFMKSCSDPDAGNWFRPGAVQIETESGPILLSFDLTYIANVPSFLRYHFMPQIETFDITTDESSIEAAILQLHPVLDQMDRSLAVDFDNLGEPSGKPDVLLTKFEPDQPKPRRRA